MEMSKNNQNDERVAGSSLPGLAVHTETQGEERAALMDQLTADMAARWQAGQRPLAEEYFEKHPFLWNEPEQAIQLIYEEVCLRSQHQETSCWEEVLERFPQWQAQLEVLLDCHRIVRSLAGPPSFPEVGETLGEFHLISELGRGTQGRVFLAKQESLAGRLVVLKVTGISGGEHLSLAQLQHTNIVPVYSTLVVPTRNLRALCMPYFGGKTLSELLKVMQRRSSTAWSGSYLVQALGDDLPDAAVRTSSRSFLSRASHVQAITWIGMCIADALKYAHDHGLLHLDIKPSNLLVAEDGQPMLLDFHLAQKPIKPDGQDVFRIGGTPGYMAPEHQAAVDAMRRQEPVKGSVDGRADIFSLGATLYEALAGTRAEKCVRLDLVNPQVSAGLADIVERCLQPNPAERYPDAEQLANDLRRHLNDLPLEGVRNRSVAERWRKWRRRRPQLLAVYALTAIVLFVAVVGALLVGNHFQQSKRAAQADLEESRQLLRSARYEDASARAETALQRLQGVSAPTASLQSELRAAMLQAKQLRTADELHKLVDKLRALYDVNWISPVAARRLHGQCKRLWDSRASLVATAKDPKFSSAEQVEADLLDIAILTAALEVRLAASSESARARRGASHILKQAETELGQNPVLSYERRSYLSEDRSRTLDLPTGALGTSWERWAFGRTMLREGRYEEASRLFREVLDKHPQNLWPNFYEGICAYRTERYLDAVVAFTVCVDQNPEMTEGYYNRAVSFSALQKPDRALVDYDRALRLRPEFPAAALNRGLLHYHANRRDAAAADFELAVAAGLDRSLLPAGF